MVQALEAWYANANATLRFLAGDRSCVLLSCAFCRGLALTPWVVQYTSIAEASSPTQAWYDFDADSGVTCGHIQLALAASAGFTSPVYVATRDCVVACVHVGWMN